MVAGFWYGFSTAVSLFLAAAILRVVWRRHLSWRTWTIPRFIPEPKVGRWQVVAVSHYSSLGERVVCRYRARWVAQRMADWFQRTSWDRSDTYEVRPVGLPHTDYLAARAALGKTETRTDEETD